MSVYIKHVSIFSCSPRLPIYLYHLWKVKTFSEPDNFRVPDFASMIFFLQKLIRKY